MREILAFAKKKLRVFKCIPVSGSVNPSVRHSFVELIESIANDSIEDQENVAHATIQFALVRKYTDVLKLPMNVENKEDSKCFKTI